CKLISEGITAWVVPLFSRGREKLRAWIVPPDSYDPDLRIKLIAQARMGNAATRNDLRREAGWAPIPGWDDVTISTAMQSNQAGEPVVPISNGASPPGIGSLDEGDPSDLADNDNMSAE